MQLNTFMPFALKPYFQQELKAYRSAMREQKLTDAWNHLERAHVIGQAYPYEHSLTHWKMLVFGCRIKNLREIIGQVPRLLLGGVKSFVGTIPVGNTGGANVPPMKSMPVPEEIQQMFRQAGIIKSY